MQRAACPIAVPVGEQPLQTVVGGEPCDEMVEDPSCGQLAQALEQCSLDHPTCVTSNGTAVNNIQACDMEQTAWDDCIDPNH